MADFPIFQTDSATAAQTRFNLELLKLAVTADTSRNVAISPLGILAALALVLHGADGVTKTALADVLFGYAIIDEENGMLLFAGTVNLLG